MQVDTSAENSKQGGSLDAKNCYPISSLLFSDETVGSGGKNIVEHGEIIIYEVEERAVEVRLDRDTARITQRQMAELFDTSSDNISLHLKNIFSDEELEKKATAEDFSAVYAPFAKEGGLGKVYQRFGDELKAIMEALNEALAA